MDTLPDTTSPITVLADRNRLATLADRLELERDNIAGMLDDLITRLKEHGTENCRACSDFQDDIEDVFLRVPDAMRWFVIQQGIKADAKEQRRIAALEKLTRDDAVALGVEEDWDDLALHRHMEE